MIWRSSSVRSPRRSVNLLHAVTGHIRPDLALLLFYGFPDSGDKQPVSVLKRQVSLYRFRNGSMPQLIRLERYRLVAYSLAILAQPPSTFWQDAACSLAEPSPGLHGKDRAADSGILPSGVLETPADSVHSIACLREAPGRDALRGILAFSAACTSFARPT